MFTHKCSLKLINLSFNLMHTMYPVETGALKVNVCSCNQRLFLTRVCSPTCTCPDSDENVLWSCLLSAASSFHVLPPASRLYSDCPIPTCFSVFAG